MKTLCVVLLGTVVATSFGCSINKSMTTVEKNQEIANFLNQTNLVYSNDLYWIKDVPLPESALGQVYEKIDKTIKVKDIENVYSAFRITGGRLFQMPDADIRKNPLTYDTEYTYNASDSADLSVITAFTGNVENLIQISKKVELKEAWEPNLAQFEADSSICNDKHYYVSRIYIGASSDVGSQEFKYKMQVAAVYVGVNATGMEKGSLHNVKQGVLAFNLQPVASLSVCKAPFKLGETPVKVTIHPIPLQEIEKEVETKGFKKVK